jgi:phage-related protein
MLGFILILALFVAIAWYVIKDMNTPLVKTVKTTAQKVEDTVEKVVDVNKDGVVNVADVKAAATKVKSVAKKVTTRKPRKKKDV